MDKVIVLATHKFKCGFVRNSANELMWQNRDGTRTVDWYEEFVKSWLAPNNADRAKQVSKQIQFNREHDALKQRMEDAANVGFTPYSYSQYLKLYNQMHEKYGLSLEEVTDENS